MTSESIDIRDWVSRLWRRRGLVVAIVAISTVGTYMLSSLQEKRYAATAQVHVTGSPAQSIVAGGTLPPTDRDTQDQAQLLASRGVSERVIERLGLEESPQELVATIVVVPSIGSNFVLVTAQRPSPREAKDVANAYVREYIRSRKRELVGDFDLAIRQLRDELEGLPERASTGQQRQELQTTLRQLQAGRAVAPSQARQTVFATTPTAPASPQPARDAFFGLVISGVLALTLVVVLERADGRIRRADDVPEIYAAPLLSTIPHADSPTLIEAGRAGVGYVLREPFRNLRANLRLGLPDGDLRLLTVTSAGPGEGKSTVVRNLALTYLEWGLSVAILEADLRRPTMSGMFGLEPGGVGLTSVVAGDVELDDALIEIAVDFAYLDHARSVTSPAAVGEPDGPGAGVRLVLLPSGPTPPNPPAILGADRTRKLIERLHDRVDLVIVDTPPLLPVSDAMPLLSLSDGVVVVARIGLTQRRSARLVMETARRVPGAAILGVVANDLPSAAGYEYGYGYGYAATAQA